MRQLKSIARAVDAGDWDRAADALLFILGEAEGELVRLSDGRSATVVDEARRLLGQFPAGEKRAIARRLGGAARLALDEALADGGAGRIRDIAVRFPLTDAATDARVRLALLHLDRGEPGLAARRLAELLDDPAAAERFADPRLRAAAVAAFARGGRPGRAAELWAGLAPDERAALELADTAGPEVPRALLAGPAPASAGSGLGEPLLVPRWRVPVVADAAARDEFLEAVDRLQRGGMALLPVWEPLTVSAGGRDLALSRTTGGAAAVDAATGEVLWRTRESGLGVGGASRTITLYSRPGRLTEAEQNPTVSAVYREAAFGTLTTDGTRLFLLEADEDASGPRISVAGRTSGVLGRPVRLAAYRLESGRLDWEIGGTLRDEPFDLPLAGWRPLAAPLVDGGDLFVVAERVAPDGLRRINLFCLDPASGRTRWTRNVASAEATITVDPVRAEWGAQCAAADGVIVVPTTVGWLAGVDRLTREVLWVERVADRQDDPGPTFRGFRNRRNSATSARNSLPKYWRPGPPLIHDGQVVVAPPGDDLLYGWTC